MTAIEANPRSSESIPTRTPHQELRHLLAIIEAYKPSEDPSVLPNKFINPELLAQYQARVAELQEQIVGIEEDSFVPTQEPDPLQAARSRLALLYTVNTKDPNKGLNPEYRQANEREIKKLQDELGIKGDRKARDTQTRELGEALYNEGGIYWVPKSQRRS